MTHRKATLLAAAFCLFSLTSLAQTPDIQALLTGFEEVAPKNTGAHGSFNGIVSADLSSINYTLTWEGLTGPPLFAHIHIGQKGVVGGIMVFLCGPQASAPSPNNTKPPCQNATSGTATGTITAADIKPFGDPPPPDGPQGFTSSDLLALMRYMFAGDTYVNVHTTMYPGGEIRGQLRTTRTAP
jgi:CHRD domain